MPPSSPLDEPPVPPHPLALRLIELLRPRLPGRVRVLDLAAGSGRNGAALTAAGFDVLAIDDAAAAHLRLPGLHGEFAGVISTHGFLHGTAAQIAERLDTVARHLQPGAVIAATFGSTRDARFGEGARIDASTYSPIAGDEQGVAHAFFTHAQLQALLAPGYDVDSIEEYGVDAIAGTWAHAQRPLSGAVHWFVVARRR